MLNSENSKERSPSTSIRINKHLHETLMNEARDNHITLSEVITRHVLSDLKRAKEVKEDDVFKHIRGEDFVNAALTAFSINRDELRQSPAACEQFCKTIHPVMFRLIGYGSTYEAVNIPLQTVLNEDYTSSVDVADNLYRYMVDYATNIYQREIGVLQALRDQYETTYKQPQEKPMGCM